MFIRDLHAFTISYVCGPKCAYECAKATHDIAGLIKFKSYSEIPDEDQNLPTDI